MVLYSFGDIKNTYYTYIVTTDGKAQETCDIYAKAVGVNGNRAMVVDLNSTDPDGWDKDKHITYDSPTDTVVWEVHVRDFSISPDSGVTDANKGKYLAFTEKGTTLNSQGVISTGIDYLKELGVTHVQLLPVLTMQLLTKPRTVLLTGVMTQRTIMFQKAHILLTLMTEMSELTSSSK